MAAWSQRRWDGWTLQESLVAAAHCNATCPSQDGVLSPSKDAGSVGRDGRSDSLGLIVGDDDLRMRLPRSRTSFFDRPSTLGSGVANRFPYVTGFCIHLNA